MLFSKAELENLVKMADHLDSEGYTQEAQQIDSTIARLVEAAKKEEDDKPGRAMSGKAKAKFRAVHKACKSLIDADLDYRGANKSQCRKVEMLCEEVCELLEECDLD